MYKKLWNSENLIVLNEINNVCIDKFIPWTNLENGSILVTGATGLLGSMLVKSILYYADKNNKNITVGAYVRNFDKAKQVFNSLPETHKNLVFEYGDISKELNLSRKYDYIIHAASNTASKDFVENPVETILTSVESTKSILEYSKQNNVKSLVYISSMEVYGKLDHEYVKEEDIGIIDISSLRSSYPQSKRLAEMLCVSYAKEYSVPVKIVRPTLTFGPGVSKSDNRVFAQFAKAVINKTDIVLLTKGGTKRDYLYTTDAVKGILIALLLGEDGEAYNLSNPDTYSTIYEMALLCKEIANGEIDVKFDLDPEKSKCYPKEQLICLDNKKLDRIHFWKKTSLKEQYLKLIEYLKSIN